MLACVKRVAGERVASDSHAFHVPPSTCASASAWQLVSTALRPPRLPLFVRVDDTKTRLYGPRDASIPASPAPPPRPPPPAPRFLLHRPHLRHLRFHRRQLLPFLR